MKRILILIKRFFSKERKSDFQRGYDWAIEALENERLTVEEMEKYLNLDSDHDFDYGMLQAMKEFNNGSTEH